MAAPAHADPRHACPGGCGRLVAFGRYACRPCWDRLPKPLRVAIVTAWSRRNMGDLTAAATAHRSAMHEAKRWFVANPLAASA